MAMNTYKDFADNDYNYFMYSYDNGLIANAMAAHAQEICEKYMKHIIDKFYDPKTEEEEKECEKALRSHNIVRLMNFIKEYIGVSYSKKTEMELRSINGYYFSARYPGDESVEVTKDDIDICAEAVKDCKEETISIIKKFKL